MGSDFLGSLAQLLFLKCLGLKLLVIYILQKLSHSWCLPTGLNLKDTFKLLNFQIPMQIISNELKLSNQSKVIELHKSGHYSSFVSGFVIFAHNIQLQFSHRKLNCSSKSETSTWLVWSKKDKRHLTPSDIGQLWAC